MRLAVCKMRAFGKHSLRKIRLARANLLLEGSGVR
jgi:hypothetical protein